jgi:hypothetical protein
LAARILVIVNATLGMLLLFAGLMLESTRGLTIGVIALLLLVASVFAIRAAIIWRRDARELGDYASEIELICPQCGYDLRGTPGRCPECGREVQTGETTVRRSENQINREGAKDAKADAKKAKAGT